ncbi:hypothetical protein WMF04_11445 [Sorangium sp. So ce260]|jgi:hypothetical protein|uniref:hypothetical protein n=1 Tax=Sorangium sp. So ce260 TaxID=3133291 RepID=UPI003F5F45ED
MAAQWLQRTAPDILFSMKAFARFMLHTVEFAALSFYVNQRVQRGCTVGRPLRGA